MSAATAPRGAVTQRHANRYGLEVVAVIRDDTELLAAVAEWETAG